jgi:hypothetical protein
VLIATALLLVAVIVGWLAFRLDGALGHGPLPSDRSGKETYVLTIVTAFLGIVAGGAALVATALVRETASRYVWLFYSIVGVLVLLLLLTPLRPYGNDSWIGLPEFIVTVPAKLVFGVMLGALLFTIGDVQRQVSRLVRFRRRIDMPGPGAPVTSTATRGLPGQFTPAAWRSLWHMQEEARRFEHAFVGTEHLLLAIIRDPRSVAAMTVTSAGLDLDSVRSQAESILGRRGSLVTGTGGLTRRCQRVIEQAARVARESNNRRVSTGHLLQSLVAQVEDAAAQILISAGLTPEQVEAEVKRIGPDAEETSHPSSS